MFKNFVIVHSFLRGPSWVVEAGNAEAVRDMMHDGGLSRWNDFELYMAI